MPKTYIVEKDYQNSRFDRWFKAKIINLPQSLIEKIIRLNKIKINRKRAKSSYRVQCGDIIEVYDISKFKVSDKIRISKYKPSRKEVNIYDDYIIENNENFVVINKPAGIAVQSGTKSLRNIIDILRKTKEFEDSSPYTVHRIDKETTGILIVAKNRKYAQLFTSLFRIRKIHKTYLGIVVGKLNESKGSFIDYLFYNEGAKKIKVKAITNFQVVDSNNNYSLLRLDPVTGRKHQLRKQLLIHGYPILGDFKYNFLNTKNNKKNSLMLHAYKINFSINGIKHKYTAELPENFKNFLSEKYLKNYF